MIVKFGNIIWLLILNILLIVFLKILFLSVCVCFICKFVEKFGEISVD